MPDIDTLMQEWPAEFEELLKEVNAGVIHVAIHCICSRVGVERLSHFFHIIYVSWGSLVQA